MSFYQLPEKTQYGRIVPKNKIYAHAGTSAKLKESFVRDVEKIIWSHKLSSETLNLPASDEIKEIQIFTIVLKEQLLSNDVLAAIDRAIPSPIVFALEFNGKKCYRAAYKRTSDADKNKRVISSYFETSWFDKDMQYQDLPMVLNLTGLYHAFLEIMMPLPKRKNETLIKHVTRVDEWGNKEKEVLKLNSRLKKEKQFNRRVEINQSIKNLKKEINKLASA
jgi:hypothetical protein